MEKLIKGITSDNDLLALADRVDVDLDDILTIDECDGRNLSKGAFIILLKGDHSDVGHWTTICNGHYFDPVGVGPPMSLGNMSYSKKQYQGAYAEYCGIFCLLWLYCKQKDKMHLLDQFVDLNIEVV